MSPYSSLGISPVSQVRPLKPGAVSVIPAAAAAGGAKESVDHGRDQARAESAVVGTETVNTVLGSITSSIAGITATYDVVLGTTKLSAKQSTSASGILADPVAELLDETTNHENGKAAVAAGVHDAARRARAARVYSEVKALLAPLNKR